MTGHSYRMSLRWTGDLGEGTSARDRYSRNHEVRIDGKPVLLLSADPVFRGDRSCYNPEELLVAALASCHMLSYLYECAVAGVVVREYRDEATGQLELTRDGGGHFSEVVLRPVVTIARGDLTLARSLHEVAHAKCYIANSVNFPVRHEPTVNEWRG